MRPHRHPHRRKLFALCVTVLLIAGCSSSFVYNRLDTLAGWYFGSLVSLDDAQRSELKHWLTHTLDWHRQSELQRYAAFLRELSQQIMQPGTTASYERTQQRFEGFWNDLLAKTAPDAATLLRSLTPRQVDELIRNMGEKSRERDEDSDNPDERRREREKGLAKFLKRWTGSVSAPQKALIAATTAQIEPTRTEWLASQQAWQTALRAALTDSTSGNGRIEQLLAHANNAWTQEYLAKSQRNRQRYMDLVGSLDATLDSRQRDHLRSRLLELAAQLDNIAREKP